MGKLDKQQEYFVMSALRQDSKEAFSLLFQTYYTDLVLFCGNFIKDKDSCEDIVQSIFLKLWNDRKNIQIEISLKSYLLKAVRNSCLDDLYAHLSRALEKIPDLYKEAFVLNRFEGLKYREIAEKLNVSERTVEVRVSKTLDLLRKQLKDFFIFLISIGIP